MAGKRGLGTTISINATNIGVLTEISGPEITADTIDITTLDVTGGTRTFIQGFMDAGEVTLKGFFDNVDTGHAAVKAALDAGTTDTYIITFPSTIGATWTFSGVVTKFKAGDATLEDPIVFEATIKVSGLPVLGTTASAGLSAATFTQTDGSTALTAAAMTPTFATGTYIYGFTYTTQTSFKVKMTGASHTIKCYVDGVYAETLTSGTAGTAIALGAAATKEIKIICYEAAKSPKTYTFMVSRLS